MKATTIVLTLSAALSIGLLRAADGPYPAGIAAWTQNDKDKQIEAGKRLLADLKAALAAKKKMFNVPKGHYRFNTTEGKRPFFLRLLQVKDFTLNGNGSTFWFNKLATALSIYKCDNVTVKNLIFDWDPLPFSQGRIISVDKANNSFTLKIDNGYETVCEGFRKQKTRFRGCLFDAKTRKLKPGQVGFNVDSFWGARDKDQNHTVKVRGFYGAKVDQIGFAPGDRFACFPRKGRTVKVECSGEVTLENITLYASSFIGYVEAAGVGPTTYRQCRILRRPGTNRLIGGNADGFNSTTMVHGPILDRCEIDTVGDDFVNIHGVYSKILKQEDPTTLIALPVPGAPKKMDLLIYDMASGRLLGKRTATRASLRYKVENNALTQTNRKWAAAGNSKIGVELNAHRITLDQPIKVDGPAYLTNTEAVGKDAVIRNCDFTGSLARGIRLQSIGTQIKCNRVTWCAGWGLTLAGQPGYWGEATHSMNVLVEDNLFEDTCIFRNRDPAAITVVSPLGKDGTQDKHIQDIKIQNNRIIRPGGNGITVEGAQNIKITGNTIQHYGDQTCRTSGSNAAPTRDVGYAVQVLNADAVLVQDNKVSKPGEFAKAETQVKK